jgi:hypothetical protein
VIRMVRLRQPFRFVLDRDPRADAQRYHSAPVTCA